MLRKEPSKRLLTSWAIGWLLLSLLLTRPVTAEAPAGAPRPWIALHLINRATDESLVELGSQLPGLAKLGVNCLILEVNYGFDFQSHPKLRASERPISKRGAQRLARTCREHGIELVPQFQCLGHQSWKETTGPLLTHYPELDLTPGAYANNVGIYCREWDPLNPRTNQIVFALMDELIDAFEAKAFHVGLDEVFLLDDQYATSTKDRDPAEVFAQVVNDLHGHLVGEHRLTMLMWADRLIDGERWGLGEWEASQVGTAPAINKIPRDIILCPWHYEPREAYESVPMLMKQGFRVLPASWKNVAASNALIEYAQKHQQNGRLVGHLFTTWSQEPADLTTWEPIVQGVPLLKSRRD
jgi:hypothetical protein